MITLFCNSDIEEFGGMTKVDFPIIADADRAVKHINIFYILSF